MKQSAAFSGMLTQGLSKCEISSLNVHTITHAVYWFQHFYKVYKFAQFTTCMYGRYKLNESLFLQVPN